MFQKSWRSLTFDISIFGKVIKLEIFGRKEAKKIKGNNIKKGKSKGYKTGGIFNISTCCILYNRNH